MTFEIRRLTELPAPEVRWLWPAWIPRGALTLLEGQPGINKSTLLSDLAARVTTGRPMPRLAGSADPGEVWLFSPEELTAQIRSRLAAADADLDRVQVIDQGTDGFGLQRDLEKLQAAVTKSPPELLILDPLVECLNGTMMSERNVRLALAPLVALAQRHSFALVGVRHLTKSAPANPLYRGGGSIAVLALARSCLLLVPDQSEQCARVLVQLKSSLGPPATALRLRVRDSAGSPAIGWLGEIPSGRELASMDSQPSGALAEAVYVLYSLLGEGPLLAEEVLAHARSNGISISTLRRAKTILGVVSQRRGFGRGSEFFWHLPPGPHPVVEQLRSDDLNRLSAQLFDGTEVEMPSEQPASSQRNETSKRRVLGPERPPTRPDNEQDDGGMGMLRF